MAIKFFISCEGDTEHWYFEWLQKAINSDPRTKNKVEFKYSSAMPSSFSKSNSNIFTKEMLSGSCFCRVQDIEEYSEADLAAFHKLLESNKTAQKLFPKFDFRIGSSNYTFEVWIISHKSQVKHEIDRKNYYKQINSAYGKNFKDNKEYKGVFGL